MLKTLSGARTRAWRSPARSITSTVSARIIVSSGRIRPRRGERRLQNASVLNGHSSKIRKSAGAPFLKARPHSSAARPRRTCSQSPGNGPEFRAFGSSRPMNFGSSRFSFLALGAQVLQPHSSPAAVGSGRNRSAAKCLLINKTHSYGLVNSGVPVGEVFFAELSG